MSDFHVLGQQKTTLGMAEVVVVGVDPPTLGVRLKGEILWQWKIPITELPVHHCLVSWTFYKWGEELSMTRNQKILMNIKKIRS